MELHGSISQNLAAAVRSARRLKGHSIHSDTIAYWAELLAYARGELAVGSTEEIQELVVELENELADRSI